VHNLYVPVDFLFKNVMKFNTNQITALQNALLIKINVLIIPVILNIINKSLVMSRGVSLPM